MSHLRGQAFFSVTTPRVSYLSFLPTSGIAVSYMPKSACFQRNQTTSNGVSVTFTLFRSAIEAYNHLHCLLVLDVPCVWCLCIDY